MFHASKHLTRSTVAALAIASAVAAVGARAHADPASSGPPTAAEDAGWEYNDEYIYGMSRSVIGARDLGPWKILIFPPTFVLDTVLLPAEAIMGLFPKPPSRTPSQAPRRS